MESTMNKEIRREGFGKKEKRQCAHVNIRKKSSNFAENFGNRMLSGIRDEVEAG